MRESVRKPRETFAAAITNRHEEPKYGGIRGDVTMTLVSAQGEIQEQRELRNVICLDASILIARLIKNNAEPPKGAYALAVGTGMSGWNLQNPDPPTNTQRGLYSELFRKTFSSTTFIDTRIPPNGQPTVIPTNVVDFSTTFSEAEAVGPIVEMGLVGGNVLTNPVRANPVPPGSYDTSVDLTQYDTLINYLTFPVLNKPPTSSLTITWRLTF